MLGDAGAAGPDFGVDAADEGEEQADGSDAGAGEAGPVGFGGFPEEAQGVKNQSGEEQHEGELHQLGVKGAEELPEFHARCSD